MQDLNVYGPFITREMARERNFKRYYEGRVCKQGHIAEHLISGKCAECDRLRCKTRYAANKAEYKARAAKRVVNKAEEVKAYQKEYRARNKAKIASNDKAYRQANKAHLKAKRQVWAAENREQLAAYYRDRYATDPVHRIKVTLRNSVNERLAQFMATKCNNTFELVGCTPAELVAHLEAQFAPGMTWDNHGEWHIDHIRPCASFDDLTDEAQQRECFHYTNLQPLWAAENLQKSDKWAA